MLFILLVLGTFYFIVLPIWMISLQMGINRLDRERAGTTPKARTAQATSVRSIAPRAPAPSSTASAVRTPRPQSSENISLEQKVGSHWFQWIGIGALLLALLFFLKWSFDSGLIGPVGRTGISYALGLGAMIGGHLLRKRYGSWALTFTGGGAAALYIVTWMAQHTYGLFPGEVALILCIAITAAVCFLAGTYGAIGLAVYGIFGGFITPILAGTTGNHGLLFLYILLLDIGVLTLAAWRGWRVLNVVSLIGTAIYEVLYITGSDMPRPQSLLFIGGFFALFAAISVVHSLVRKVKSEEGDVIVHVLNALVHFGLILVWMDVVPGLREQYDAGVALIFAVFSLLFAAAIYGNNKTDKPIVIGSIGLAVFFSALTIPLQFDGPWISFAWSIEGAFLLWLALQLNDPRLQRFGWCVMTASYIWYFVGHLDGSPGIFLRPDGLFVITTWMAICSVLAVVGLGRSDRKEQQVVPFLIVTLGIAAVSMFLNTVDPNVVHLNAMQRFLQAAALIAGGYIVLFQAKSRWQTLAEDERGLFSMLAIALQIVTLGYLTGEFIRGVNNGTLLGEVASPRQTILVGTSILWAVYGSFCLSIGIAYAYRSVRLFGMVLLLITAAKLTLVDFFSLGTGARIIGFTILGGLLVGASLVYQHKKDVVDALLKDKK